MKNEIAYEVTKVENGFVYDEFLSLPPENCGVGIMTEEKVKMLISELNKRNRNRDDVIIDTISEGIGIIHRHD